MPPLRDGPACGSNLAPAMSIPPWRGDLRRSFRRMQSDPVEPSQSDIRACLPGRDAHRHGSVSARPSGTVHRRSRQQPVAAWSHAAIYAYGSASALPRRTEILRLVPVGRPGRFVLVDDPMPGAVPKPKAVTSRPTRPNRFLAPGSMNRPPQVTVWLYTAHARSTQRTATSSTVPFAYQAQQGAPGSAGFQPASVEALPTSTRARMPAIRGTGAREPRAGGSRARYAIRSAVDDPPDRGLCCNRSVTHG